MITKRFVFEAAHFLPHVPEGHKCRRMHGHSYTAWVHVGGPVDPAMGWIVDFGDVKRVWRRLESDLDHHLLNEVPGLGNPTAERLAAWIWERFDRERAAGSAGFFVAAVEVAETEDSRALFVAPGRQAWVPGHVDVTIPEVEPVARLAEGASVSADLPRVPPAATVSPESSPESLEHIEDVQSRPDDRGIALDEVGVTRVRVPIEVLDRDHGAQRTVAHVTMAVDLPAEVKGTHLSRFLEALRGRRDGYTLFSLAELTGQLRERLGAGHARVRVEFPYFITKAAPVTGAEGELDVDCAFEVVDYAGALEHWLEVVTPVTTVCPCSRDISDYGAHNQRGRVSIRVRCTDDEAGLPTLVWIEELVEVAEASASSPVYPVIKRPDERHVTMAAYDKPRFVEDVVREAALRLAADPRVALYEITVENDESIHAHNAYAKVSGPAGARGDVDGYRP